MRAPEKNIKSINSVLDDCFRSLAETGLEKASVRSFYKATNLSSSSLYYRFESKDEIIIEATYNRLYSITNDLFFCAAENIGSFESLARNFSPARTNTKRI
ncbi:MAG: TetR/AcrR family transcriptional regulator [Eubacteriales bacterium]